MYRYLSHFRALLLITLMPAPLFSQIFFAHSIQQVAHAGVLYAGIDNRILLSGRGTAGEITVWSSAGSMVIPGKGSFVIRPAGKAETDTLRVMSKGVELGSRIFRVLTHADPLPQLAFTPDTSMPLARILENPYLAVWHPDGKSASGLRVVSFNCSIRNKSGEVLYFSSASNRLTAEMLTALKTMRKESVIEFDQIRVNAGDRKPAKFIPALKVVVR